MIVLLILMLLLLAPALWVYIYIWRGLNRRVIAAVKVVDPIITLGPYAMGAWAALSACVAVNIWCEGTARLIGNIITLTIAVGCALWAGFWLLMHCLGGQTPGKRPTWWREAVAAKFAWRNLESMPAYLGARTSILPVANLTAAPGRARSGPPWRGTCRVAPTPKVSTSTGVKCRESTR